MAHAANEDAASPTGSTAADSMIRLLYLEIIRKDDYKEWKKNPQLCPQPRVSMSTIDDSTSEGILERFDISHLSEHLTTWEKQLPTTTVQPFFSFSDVNAMTENSPERTFHYEMDGLTWSYAVDEIVGTIKKKGQKNSRHKQTCFDDWVVLEKRIWDKLKPFQTFMATWCGNDYDPQRVEKTALYHSGAKRVDICMRLDHIAIEFSFEHSFPVALEDDFWDQA